ncbi:MAG: DnaJ domain-containing protein [Candidatus Sericytochromatia bacterium]|nr:DnaJ domain-containing protein [Candidatus Sericytochromatia bacterium]
MKSYYDVLGVARNATSEDIRRAFRSEAKRLHPDTVNGTANAMIQLNEAYDTLKDPARRGTYDQTQQRQSYRLQRRPASQSQAGMDPIDYVALVFRPLDLNVVRALRAIDLAIDELAYDIYDDIYIAKFGDALQATQASLSLAYRQLLSVEWPVPLMSALNLYRQGIRQAEDAIEDFGTFMINLDTDALVEGRSILRWAVEMLDEAREALGLV